MFSFQVSYVCLLYFIQMSRKLYKTYVLGMGENICGKLRCSLSIQVRAYALVIRYTDHVFGHHNNDDVISL